MDFMFLIYFWFSYEIKIICAFVSSWSIKFEQSIIIAW
jgi:hypothetical protein